MGFDPRSLGNLTLWLDASRITGLNDGDAVATWADLSGNGRDAAQGTAANRPIYKPTGLLGRPSVRFDGSNDRLVTGAIDLTAFTAVTTYVVFSCTQTAIHFAIDVGDAVSGTGASLRASSTQTVQFGAKGNVGTNHVTAPNGSLPASGAVVASTVDFSLTAASENTGWINGTKYTAVGTNNNTGAFGATDTIKIGTRNTAGDFFVGDIAEVLVYTGRHDDATVAIVTAYLRAKWGTA